MLRPGEIGVTLTQSIPKIRSWCCQVNWGRDPDPVPNVSPKALVTRKNSGTDTQQREQMTQTRKVD